MLHMNKVAISYARFSSTGQAEGDSLRRQIEAANAYAEANGLVMDQKYRFNDLGLSAYDRSNVQRGGLGQLLRAVEDGKIEVGTTLIVESFDRLSRADPYDALGIFQQIIGAGLSLVTLTTPPKVFNRASIDANMFQLFDALMEMQRANAESARKSQLVGAAWKDKKRRAINGEIMSAKAPHWIDVVVNHALDKKHPYKRKAAINPERGAVVLRILEMAERGVGNHTIIRTLHAEGIASWSKSRKWEPSYIQKIVHSPALFGGIEIDGEIVEGYYPALIEKGRYNLICALRAERATTKNTNRKGVGVTNLFSGLLKCGYCGSAMNIAGYKENARSEGRKPYERRYVACHGARIGATNCKMKMWFMDELEPALLFWMTYLDYATIMNVGKKSSIESEKQKLASLEAQLSSAKSRIEHVMVAIEEGATGMVPRLKQHEATVASLSKDAKKQRLKVVARESQDGAGASRMKGLIALFKALKDTTSEIEHRVLREQLSAAIAAEVERIVLYPAGRLVQGDKRDRFADVLFKNGMERRLEVGEC